MKIPMPDLEELPEAFSMSASEPVPKSLDDELGKQEGYAHFYGRNFCGYVWFDGGVYNCNVYTYAEHQTTISATTLEDLWFAVCSEYGFE